MRTCDGYTMLACNSSTYHAQPRRCSGISATTRKATSRRLTTVVSAPLVLVVNPENPKTADIKTVDDLRRGGEGRTRCAGLRLGRQRQPGPSSHGVCSSQKAGIKLIHVPYRGGAASEVGILAQEVLGRVRSALRGAGWSRPASCARWRCRRPSGRRRCPMCRSVAEAGYPGFDISFWVGFFMPKATPAPILGDAAPGDRRGGQSIRCSLDQASSSQGVVSVLTPAEYAAKIAKETRELAEVVAAADIKAE